MKRVALFLFLILVMLPAKGLAQCIASGLACTQNSDCCSLNCSGLICVGPTVTPTNSPTVTPTVTVTNTPTVTPTPGPNDCCQCGAGVCLDISVPSDCSGGGCSVVYGAVCDTDCVTRTPTVTPTVTITPGGPTLTPTSTPTTTATGTPTQSPTNTPAASPGVTRIVQICSNSISTWVQGQKPYASSAVSNANNDNDFLIGPTPGPVLNVSGSTGDGRALVRWDLAAADPTLDECVGGVTAATIRMFIHVPQKDNPTESTWNRCPETAQAGACALPCSTPTNLFCTSQCSGTSCPECKPTPCPPGPNGCACAGSAKYLNVMKVEPTGTPWIASTPNGNPTPTPNNGATWNCPNDVSLTNSSPDCDALGGPIQWEGGLPPGLFTGSSPTPTPIAQFEMADTFHGQVTFYDRLSSGAISAVVQQWITNPTTNHGVVIKKDNESIAGDMDFASSKAPNNADEVPCINIALAGCPDVTNTPTFTFTPTNTPTNTSTRTATPTNSFTHTFTFTPTSTNTRTPTRTNTPTITQTPNCATFQQLGSEFQVNVFTTGEQNAGIVHFDRITNDFVVAWKSAAQDGGGYGIFANGFNASGVATQGTEFQVNSYTTGNQILPAISGYITTNGVITWDSDGGHDGSLRGVFGQRLNYSGSDLGTEFQINTFTTGNQQLPDVSRLSNNGFVVVWTDSGLDGSFNGIFGQKYSSAGSAIGTEFQINTYTTGIQSLPKVSGSGDGRFVVVWASLSQDGSSIGVFGQRFDTAGSATGTEFQVNVITTDDQTLPDVGMDANGNFVVDWYSYAVNLELKAKRYSSSGAVVGTEFKVNTTALDVADTGNQRIAVSDDGDFVFVWSTNNAGSGSREVFGQRYWDNGMAMGTEFQINQFTTGNQDDVSIDQRDDGQFVATWKSTDGNQAGIFAQRLCFLAPTFTPTNTPTRTATVTATNTTSSVLQPIYFANTSTPTVTPTATVTSTKNPNFQDEEVAAETCVTSLLTGPVFEVTGSLAASKRLNIDVTYDQLVNGCLIRPSYQTVRTSASGELGSDATVIAGSIVNLTLEGGIPYTVQIPNTLIAGQLVSLASMLGSGSPFLPGQTLTDIDAIDLGDYSMTSTVTNNTATLTKQSVTDLHLTADGMCNNYKIENVGTATTIYDLVPYGQPTTGDMTGIWPNPTMTRPIRAYSFDWDFGPIGIGTCSTVTIPEITDIPSESLISVTPDNIVFNSVWDTYLNPSGELTLRLCALANINPPLRTWTIEVWQ